MDPRPDGTPLGRDPATPLPLDLSPRPRRGRRVVIVLGSLLVVTLVAAAIVVAWVNRQFDEIPTFAESAPGWVPPTTFVPDTAPAANGAAPQDVAAGVDGPVAPPPAPPGKRGVTFLLFSTGSQGLSAADARELNIPADRAGMADGLTDSIMLVTAYADTGQVGVLSIPRDLYIPQIGDRINTVFNRSGPRALALTVGRMTGLPVDHMIAVNFSAFGDLTDAVGGVDLWVDGPARDRNTGFEVTASKCVHMDGALALEYARSRHWEVSDGVNWRLDASADDFGRIRRQQSLLRAAAKKLTSAGGLTSVAGAAGVAQRTLTVDPDLDFRTVSSLALDLLRSPTTSIHTFSYAGTPGWAGAASVVYTDAARNAAPLAAMQDLLAGRPLASNGGGEVAPPAAGPVSAPRAC